MDRRNIRHLAEISHALLVVNIQVAGSQNTELYIEAPCGQIVEVFIALERVTADVSNGKL